VIELKIDPEFRDKIPPMPEEDFKGLREDILRDGYVRDPLVVWKEENILLDGHHRWRVIQENPDVLNDKFTVDYKSFKNRWEAIAWICANQIHKHNMTEIQKEKLLQEEYDARQKSTGGQIGNKNAKKRDGEIPQVVFTNLVTGDENPLPSPKNPGKEPTTRNILAKEHNISPDDVRSAVEVGRGIDRGEEVEPGFKNQILSGEIKATKKDLKSMRKMSDEDIKTKIEEIRNPKPKTEKNLNIQPIKSNRAGWSKGDREIAERTNRIIEMQTNGESDYTITIEDLLKLIEADGEDYVSSLKNTLVVRSTILVGENRAMAADAIETIIKKIISVKELLK